MLLIELKFKVHNLLGQVVSTFNVDFIILLYKYIIFIFVDLCEIRRQ